MSASLQIKNRFTGAVLNTYEISTASGSVIGNVWARSEYDALKEAERLYYVAICSVVARRT